jgi:hypothetical protein
MSFSNDHPAVKGSGFQTNARSGVLTQFIFRRNSMAFHSFFSNAFLRVVEEPINTFRKESRKEFTTIELIETKWGHYHSDSCSPNDSINANIGKFLSENENALSIRFLREEPADNTTTAVWTVLPK